MLYLILHFGFRFKRFRVLIDIYRWLGWLNTLLRKIEGWVFSSFSLFCFRCILLYLHLLSWLSSGRLGNWNFCQITFDIWDFRPVFISSIFHCIGIRICLLLILSFVAFYVLQLSILDCLFVVRRFQDRSFDDLVFPQINREMLLFLLLAQWLILTFNRFIGDWGVAFVSRCWKTLPGLIYRVRDARLVTFSFVRSIITTWCRLDVHLRILLLVFRLFGSVTALV